MTPKRRAWTAIPLGSYFEGRLHARLHEEPLHADAERAVKLSVHLAWRHATVRLAPERR